MNKLKQIKIVVNIIDLFFSLSNSIAHRKAKIRKKKKENLIV